MSRKGIILIALALLAAFATAALAWPPLNPAILGAKVFSGASGSVTWANYTWATEGSLKTDQDNDGVADTDTCLMESLVLGGDETSSNGYTYYATSSSFSAATGTPPYRTSDGNDGNRLYAAAGLDTLVTSAQWSIFVKVNLTNFVNKTLVHFLSGDGSQRIQLYGDGSGYLSLSLYEDWSVETNTVSVALPVSTDVLIGVWADGTNTVRFGFTTTVSSTPTKWSSFTSSRRAALASLRGDYSSTGFAAWRVFYSLYNATEAVAGKLYGSVVSSKCFIDNAS